jgi:hypothetical protein
MAEIRLKGYLNLEGGCFWSVIRCKILNEASTEHLYLTLHDTAVKVRFVKNYKRQSHYRPLNGARHSSVVIENCSRKTISVTEVVVQTIVFSRICLLPTGTL